MKRNQGDTCLLCKVNDASSIESHIVSKFIGKSILADGGKGYVLNSDTPDRKPEVKQDSPKEPYILCEGCEKFFEILETDISRDFAHKILKSKYDDQFSYQDNGGGIEFARCQNVNNIVFRLFILSIFWRCSITSVKAFINFKINEEEELRQILVKFIHCDIKSLKAIDQDDIFNIPIVILRHKNEDYDKTTNFFYGNSGNNDLYQLMLNEYVFFFSFNMNEFLFRFDFLVNMGKAPFKIGLLQDSSWISLKEGLLEREAEQHIKKAMDLGVTPWSWPSGKI